MPKCQGRPKGSPNKKSEAIAEKLRKLGCDPIKGMALIAKEAIELGDLALAGNMYKELAQYVAPKRKAIELTGEGGGAIKTESLWTVLPVTPVNATTES